MDLQDKVVLVTGGGSGLGRATTLLLAGKGARVAVLDVNEAAAAATVDEAGGDKAIAIGVDVRSDESVSAAVEAVVERWGAVHLLVNCAGVAPAERTLNRAGEPMPLENFRSVIDINLVGSFNMARVAAAAMARNEPIGEAGERGLIVNTASVAGYEGQIGQTAYAASKGGILALNLPMARDLAPLGIRVNAIAPGTMGTPMLLGMPENVQQGLVSNIQFPKRLGHPEEFAALVAHMAENAYINGETVRLDGALRMQPK